MATYIPKGVDIPVEGLSNGSITNNDGHGWAVARGSEMLVGKSMHFAVALDGFIAAREELGMSSVAMFHSRFGTHGEYGEYNIHPFYVDDEQTTVMAHNGILPMAYHPDHKDRRSDTRIFVDRIASFVDNPNGIPSRRGGKLLGSMIGQGNKLVFMSVRSGEPKVRVVNADAGIQDQGVWYSNSGYIRSKWMDWASGWRSQGSRWSNEDLFKDPYEGEGLYAKNPGVCDMCGSKDTDKDNNACWNCGHCLDCYEFAHNCLCYTPARVLSDEEQGEVTGSYESISEYLERSKRLIEQTPAGGWPHAGGEDGVAITVG
jgi:glutamine amidotransferase